MTRAYHGTGEQAIEWILHHADFDDRCQSSEFLKAWEEGDAEAEWPSFYEWLDGEMRVVDFLYTNYKGEVAVRKAVPRGIRFGTTPWHPEPGYLMEAWDVDKQEVREFALADCDFTHPKETMERLVKQMLNIELQADSLEKYAEQQGFSAKPPASSFHWQATHFRDIAAEMRKIFGLPEAARRDREG